MMEHGHRVLLTVSGWLLVSVALTVALMRYLPTTGRLGLAALALYPFVAMAAPLAACAFALAQRWFAFGLVSILAIVALTPVVSYRNGGEATPDARASLSVMTANLRLGTADSLGLVRTAEAGADVFAVQELTDQQLAGIEAAGINVSHPYRFVRPDARSAGIGLWSRYPIADGRVLDDYTLPTISVRLRVPQTHQDVQVIVVHIANGLSQSVRDWRADLTRLKIDMAAATPAKGSCVVVAGDFNSTRDMVELRRLASDGYSFGSWQAGTRFLATFPANSRPIPPLIGIDHILTHGCEARSVRTVDVVGSDHLGLWARVESI